MDSVQFRALVVDDEPHVADVVAEYLAREGFDVRLAHDGLTALEVAREFDPAVVILDVMLPGLDGYEVCRQLRTFSGAYVLMLTARGEETDTVIGLSSGADDYVVKPFGPRELVARVKALMRRPRQLGRPVDDAGDKLTIGPLTLSLETRRADCRGTVLDLTRTEFDILTALARRPRAVLSRRQIIDTVWNEDWVGDDHVVDVHIGNIRAKLDQAAPGTDLIRTVRGVGYALEPRP